MGGVRDAREIMDSEQTFSVLVTGGTGLVGSYLVPFLRQEGHTVRLLSRSSNQEDARPWNPERGQLAREDIDGIDAVVHLAGESISRRWTADVRNAIRRSRVVGTRLLSERLASLESKPRVLVSASGVNFYGTQPGVLLDEEGEGGSGFLADVCQRWEDATSAAREAGIRVVNLRLGTVISARGGALPMMLKPFRMGMGGPVGSGRQIVSWISGVDVARVIHHVLQDDSLSGPVNAVSPERHSNRDFARCLGKVMGKPSCIPAPAFVVRTMYGKMAEETVLADIAVEPAKLKSAGFEFSFPRLQDALEHELHLHHSNRT